MIFLFFFSLHLDVFLAVCSLVHLWNVNSSHWSLKWEEFSEALKKQRKEKRSKNHAIDSSVRYMNSIEKYVSFFFFCWLRDAVTSILGVILCTAHCTVNANLIDNCATYYLRCGQLTAYSIQAYIRFVWSHNVCLYYIKQCRHKCDEVTLNFSLYLKSKLKFYILQCNNVILYDVIVL